MILIISICVYSRENRSRNNLTRTTRIFYNMKILFLSLSLTLGFALWTVPTYAQDGEAIWKKNQCATCHGDKGKGDGMVAKSLPAGTVSDLSKGEFKFAKSEEKFKELLKKGGAAVKLNPMMPPAPGVTPEEAAILYKWILGLSKK